MICAAGIGSGKFGFPFWNLEPADWPRVLEVNVMGMVKTPLNESVWSAGQEQLPEEERQSYEDWAADKIKTIAPLGRWQQPPEFGAMAAYLASPHAHNITGQTINIDGGQVMHA